MLTPVCTGITTEIRHQIYRETGTSAVEVVERQRTVSNNVVHLFVISRMERFTLQSHTYLTNTYHDADDKLIQMPIQAISCHIITVISKAFSIL